MNRQLQGHLPVWVRHTSLLMCAVFVHVNVVYAAVEPAKSFWKERKAAADRLAVGAIHESPQPTLLAQIPSDFLPQVSHPAQSIVPVPGLAPSLKPDLKLPSASLPKWFSAISASHVTLKDLYVPPSWKPGDFMLIHIQDAHGNVEAQQNIAKTIESLAVGTGDHGGTPLLIGIEGARGAFDFHPYQSFPDREVTKEISDYFIKNGFITGPEYVGMTTKLPITFWGVEDEKPYLEHVQALKDSNPLQKEALKKLEGLSQSLELHKDKELNPALRELDRKIVLHRKGQMGLGEFLKYLVSSRLRSNNKFNLRASETSREEFPVIRQFLEALKSEESLDYAKVESERSSLTRSLANELPKSELENLVKASLAYRVGNLTHSAFYKYLKDLCRAYGVQITKYPEMDKYIRYVLLSETIKQEQLFAEVTEMEAKAIESLITTPQEREVIEASKSLAMSEKLAKYELSPEEWKSYKSSPKTPFLRPFEKFNEAAIARNEILVNNLLNRHSRERGNPLAVIVTGGFHTSGMTELLKSKQVAYAVLTPRLGRVEGSGTDYLSVFTRDKTPLEKLFTGERIQLADQSVAANPIGVMESRVPMVERLSAVMSKLRGGRVPSGLFLGWLGNARYRTITDFTEQDSSMGREFRITGNIQGKLNRAWVLVRSIVKGGAVPENSVQIQISGEAFAVSQGRNAWYYAAGSAVVAAGVYFVGIFGPQIHQFFMNTEKSVQNPILWALPFAMVLFSQGHRTGGVARKEYFNSFEEMLRAAKVKFVRSADRIAEAAGVSRRTVYHALAGRPMKELTKERILAGLKSFGLFVGKRRVPTPARIQRDSARERRTMDLMKLLDEIMKRNNLSVSAVVAHLRSRGVSVSPYPIYVARRKFLAGREDSRPRLSDSLLSVLEPSLKEISVRPLSRNQRRDAYDAANRGRRESFQDTSRFLKYFRARHLLVTLHGGGYRVMRSNPSKFMQYKQIAAELKSRGVSVSWSTLSGIVHHRYKTIDPRILGALLRELPKIIAERNSASSSKNNIHTWGGTGRIRPTRGGMMFWMRDALWNPVFSRLYSSQEAYHQDYWKIAAVAENIAAYAAGGIIMGVYISVFGGAWDNQMFNRASWMAFAAGHLADIYRASVKDPRAPPALDAWLNFGVACTLLLINGFQLPLIEIPRIAPPIMIPILSAVSQCLVHFAVNFMFAEPSDKTRVLPRSGGGLHSALAVGAFLTYVYFPMSSLPETVPDTVRSLAILLSVAAASAVFTGFGKAPDENRVVSSALKDLGAKVEEMKARGLNDTVINRAIFEGINPLASKYPETFLKCLRRFPFAREFLNSTAGSAIKKTLVKRIKSLNRPDPIVSEASAEGMQKIKLAVMVLDSFPTEQLEIILDRNIKKVQISAQFLRSSGRTPQSYRTEILRRLWINPRNMNSPVGERSNLNKIPGTTRVVKEFYAHVLEDSAVKSRLTQILAEIESSLYDDQKSAFLSFVGLNPDPEATNNKKSKTLWKSTWKPWTHVRQTISANVRDNPEKYPLPKISTPFSASAVSDVPRERHTPFGELGTRRRPTAGVHFNWGSGWQGAGGLVRSGNPFRALGSGLRGMHDTLKSRQGGTESKARVTLLSYDEAEILKMSEQDRQALFNEIREFYGRGGAVGAEDFLKGLLEGNDDAMSGRTVILARNRKIFGCLIMKMEERQIKGRDEYCGVIENVNVDSSLRERFIGRRLMAQAAKDASRQRANWVAAEFRENGPESGFFENLAGYVFPSRSSNGIYEDGSTKAFIVYPSDKAASAWNMDAPKKPEKKQPASTIGRHSVFMSQVGRGSSNGPASKTGADEPASPASQEKPAGVFDWTSSWAFGARSGSRRRVSSAPSPESGENQPRVVNGKANKFIDFLARSLDYNKDSRPVVSKLFSRYISTISRKTGASDVKVRLTLALYYSNYSDINFKTLDTNQKVIIIEARKLFAQDPFIAAQRERVLKFVHEKLDKFNQDLFKKLFGLEREPLPSQGNRKRVFTPERDKVLVYLSGEEPITIPDESAPKPQSRGQHVVSREGLKPEQARALAQRLRRDRLVREISGRECSEIGRAIARLNDPILNKRLGVISSRLGKHTVHHILSSLAQKLQTTDLTDELNGRIYRYRIFAVATEDLLTADDGTKVWSFPDINEEKGTIDLYVGGLEGYDEYPRRLAGMIHEGVEFLLGMSHQWAFVLEGAAGGTVKAKNSFGLQVVVPFRVELEKAYEKARLEDPRRLTLVKKEIMKVLGVESDQWMRNYLDDMSSVIAQNISAPQTAVALSRVSAYPSGIFGPTRYYTIQDQLNIESSRAYLESASLPIVNIRDESGAVYDLPLEDAKVAAGLGYLRVDRTSSPEALVWARSWRMQKIGGSKGETKFSSRRKIQFRSEVYVLVGDSILKVWVEKKVGANPGLEHKFQWSGAGSIPNPMELGELFNFRRADGTFYKYKADDLDGRVLTVQVKKNDQGGFELVIDCIGDKGVVASWEVPESSGQGSMPTASILGNRWARHAPWLEWAYFVPGLVLFARPIMGLMARTLVKLRFADASLLEDVKPFTSAPMPAGRRWTAAIASSVVLSLAFKSIFFEVQGSLTLAVILWFVTAAGVFALEHRFDLKAGSRAPIFISGFYFSSLSLVWSGGLTLLCVTFFPGLAGLWRVPVMFSFMIAVQIVLHALYNEVALRTGWFRAASIQFLDPDSQPAMDLENGEEDLRLFSTREAANLIGMGERYNAFVGWIRNEIPVNGRVIKPSQNIGTPHKPRYVFTKNKIAELSQLIFPDGIPGKDAMNETDIKRELRPDYPESLQSWVERMRARGKIKADWRAWRSGGFQYLYSPAKLDQFRLLLEETPRGTPRRITWARKIRAVPILLLAAVLLPSIGWSAPQSAGAFQSGGWASLLMSLGMSLGALGSLSWIFSMLTVPFALGALYLRENEPKYIQQEPTEEELANARRIAVKVARGYAMKWRYDGAEDLVSEGMLRFWHRYPDFLNIDDSDKEKFTYGIMNQAMMDYMRKNVFPSRGVQKNANNIAQAIKILRDRFQLLGNPREPEEGDISSFLGLDIEAFREHLKSITSLHSVLMAEGKNFRHSTGEDNAVNHARNFVYSPSEVAGQEAKMIEDERARMFWDAFAQLSLRQQFIVWLHDFKDQELTNIARMLGIGRSGVGFHYQNAMKRLKEVLSSGVPARSELSREQLILMLERTDAASLTRDEASKNPSVPFHVEIESARYVRAAETALKFNLPEAALRAVEKALVLEKESSKALKIRAELHSKYPGLQTARLKTDGEKLTDDEVLLFNELAQNSDLSQREIAGVLGISDQTVSIRIRKTKLVRPNSAPRVKKSHILAVTMYENGSSWNEIVDALPSNRSGGKYTESGARKVLKDAYRVLGKPFVPRAERKKKKPAGISLGSLDLSLLFERPLLSLAAVLPLPALIFLNAPIAFYFLWAAVSAIYFSRVDGVPAEFPARNEYEEVELLGGFAGVRELLPRPDRGGLRNLKPVRPGFDGAKYQRNLSNIGEMENIFGAKSVENFVFALGGSASSSEINSVSAQIKIAKDSGKNVRLALFGNNPAKNLRAELLRKTLDVSMDIVEDSEDLSNVLDLDRLYAKIEQASQLSRFALFVYADPSLQLSSPSRNPLIYVLNLLPSGNLDVLTWDLSQRIKESAAAAVSQ